MRTIIVDDERPAREELIYLLKSFPEINIVGEAGDPTSAVRLIQQEQPDVVFLDIRMPGGTGFEVLEKLEPPFPFVIFTTAYESHAIQAFEVDALDYLLKPIESSRLEMAIQKLRRQIQARVEADPTRISIEDRVFLRQDERAWFIPVRDIIRLEADGNYTRVYFIKGKALLLRSLSSLEEKLPPQIFFRINRSEMINLTFIKDIEPWFSGSLKVTLTDGTSLEMSRRQAQIFREQKTL
jgi:two-component system LytT family response regulator